MKTINDIVLENITRKMNEHGLNQRTLAKKAEVDPVVVNRVFKKKRGAGKVLLGKLAKALGCDIGDFYNNHSVPKENPSPQKADPSRSDLFAALVSIASTLDHDQLEVVLAAAEIAQSSSSSLSTTAASKVR